MVLWSYLLKLLNGTIVITHTPPFSRRRWIQLATTAPFSLSASPLPAAEIPAGTRPKSIPVHLPDRLSICYYGWDWITAALPDEAFGDLERALLQSKERGYNCLRVEAGLNWMFDPQGNRRGKIKFGQWI